MTELLERPRLAAVVCAALVAIVVVAIPAGGALAGDGDCSDASGADGYHERNAEGKEA